MRQILREYQIDALERTRAEYAAGRRRVLLVAPTGAGKTSIAAAIIESAVSKGRKVLALAHRKELIDQLVTRLLEHDILPGVIRAGVKPAPHRPVQVASVQTLARREVPASDLLIIDEAHHATCKSYQRAVDAGRSVLGLTATPCRLSGRGLGDLFDSMVVVSSPAELTRLGFLVPVVGFAYSNPDMRGVKRVGGDYAEDGAAQAMGYVGGDIVKRWIAFRPGPTILFACTIAHSLRLVEMFTAAGVRAGHVDGSTPAIERDALFARLASGALEVLSNVGVATEGVDVPSLRCIILARPTTSSGLALQMAGRGLRPFPGKTSLRLHDHAGVTLMHGLPDQDREWDLDAGSRSSSDPAPATRTCSACFAIFSPRSKCPVCGADLASRRIGKERKVNEVEGVEVELSQVRQVWSDPGKARARYAELLKIQHERGYKQKYAACALKAELGMWPPRSWG
jgi:superfamily II DNA or RNA helicase